MSMLLIYFLTIFLYQGVFTCTNILVTPGASTTGSTIISYSADSHTTYGALRFFPKNTPPAGSQIPIFEWDSGKYLGNVSQVEDSYRVYSNMNEHQLIITETTFGGLEELAGRHPDDHLDYGNLIWLTLQRAKTAEDAIRIIGELIEEYGYASEGESFSIGDPNSVYIMEIIGRGSEEKGAVWVAVKIPDGYISSHANQARITTFPLTDETKAIYHPDVVNFAIRKGLYDGEPEKFSFSDVYAPVDFGSARWCEARVWSVFRKIDDTKMDKYLDYARGINLKNRMPLYIRPSTPISVADVKSMMRDHFEGTFFDMGEDIGAIGDNLLYRWRPMQWKASNGKEYIHERAIATQQTGFGVIGECTKINMNTSPSDAFGILWFGVDDTGGIFYTPFFLSTSEIPLEWSMKSGSITEFTDHSAFWLWNQINHFAYTRYSTIFPDVIAKIREMESTLKPKIEAARQEAKQIYNSGNAKTAEILLSNFSISTANYVYSEFKKFYGTLFVKFFDGDKRIINYETNKIEKVEFLGYNQRFYDQIAATTDKKLRFLNSTESDNNKKKNEETAERLASFKIFLSIVGILIFAISGILCGVYIKISFY